MNALALPFLTRRRARPAAPTLTPVQIRWLGALLIATQLPQAPHLPIWIALFGMTLVLLRLWLARRDRLRPAAPPARIPSWALVLFATASAWFVRASYGYLVGRDPSVAFLFILVGIKFLEARSVRDGSLLVCLAAFLLITPFFTNQSPFAALAALPALLVIGGALDALSRGATAGEPPPWRRTLRRNALMMVQGLPLAAMLFVLFPRLAGPLWGLPQDYSAKSGLSDSMAPGMISELSLSDVVVFRVDFDGPPPPPPQRYWRGPVLARFDGRAWTSSPQRGEGVLAPYDAPGIAYTVTLEPSFKPWLFALELPASLPRPATADDAGAAARFAILTPDQQLIARTPVTQVTRYTQLSLLRNHYAQTTSADIATSSAMPPGNPRTRAFARELRERFPDDRAYIDALLAHFHDQPFVYTLTPPLLLRDPVDMFMFDEQRGFCEHYASAFVVLLRAAGIPARVVTGYQGGEINTRGGGYMIVRQSDAHAWAEALLDGQWQRFDPTGAVAPSRIERGLAGALPESDLVPLFARLDGGWLKGTQLAFDALNHAWRRNVVGFDRGRQREVWRDWNVDRLNAPWMVAVAAAFVAIWGGVLFGVFAWRRHRGDRARVLWDDACARLARAGLPRQPHEGPLAYAARASARWPQFSIAFAAIAESYAALRYGNAAAGPGQRSALLATLARAVDVLPAPASLRGAGRAA